MGKHENSRLSSLELEKLAEDVSRDLATNYGIVGGQALDIIPRQGAVDGFNIYLSVEDLIKADLQKVVYRIYVDWINQEIRPTFYEIPKGLKGDLF